MGEMGPQIFTLSTLKQYAIMGGAGLLFAISAIVFMFQQMWGQAGIALILLPTIFVPLLLEKWLQFRMPVSLQVQYALLLVLGPYVGGTLGLYIAWPPWDTVVHFYSGIPISFAIIRALGLVQQKYRIAVPVWFEIFVLIAAKTFIAFIWEIGEFSFDLLFDANTQDDNFDTMTDMIAGITPSLFIASALVMHRRNGRFKYFNSLLTHWRAI